MRRTRMMMAGSALALSLALTACGGDESSEEPTSPSSESASESPSEASESPAESEATQAGGSDYCQQLDAANEQFAALAAGEFGQFEAVIDSLQEVQDVSPPDIAKAWEEFIAPLTKVEAALDKAGLTFADLEGVSRGEIPPGVDPQSLQQVAAEIQGLNSTANAQQQITEQATAECGIDLGQ